METSLARPPIAGGYLGWTALGVFALAVSWFYSWEPASDHAPWFTRQPVGYYNELADAFLAGRTSLLRQPDPRLVALADPYDPTANAPYRVNDVSYYKGRYFLYMGPAPAVVVFIPAHLLTGRYLTEKAACSLLGILGAVASAALLLHLRRHWLPDTPAAVAITAMAMLALADGYFVAVRGSIAQQVPIVNAYAFAMLALWSAARAATAASRAGGWLALASLGVGISIASRPNYVFASAALLPPLLLMLRQGNRRRPRALLGLAAAAALPLGGVVALFLAYNWVRFGHILEFGQRYQLGGWNQLKLSSSGLGHGWENAWRYLVAPAHYSRTFPFVSAPTWIAVSVLRHVPWLWLLPAAAWSLARGAAPAAVRSTALSAAILSATNFLTLVFLPSGNPAAILTSANARYLLDFQPALVLFVCLGVVACFRPDPLGPRVRRWLLAPAAGILALASVVIALSLDIGTFPAESCRPLAYVLDLPAFLLEKARGERYGPLGASVIFPQGRTGAYEPLVSTGSPDASDLLYVHYASATQIQLGWVGSDMQGPLTAPIPVAYGVPHHLDIGMGSLYPPSGHPSWAGLSEPQVAFLMRSLHVEIDGRTVLDAQVHFHPAQAGQVALGRNPYLAGYSAAVFSGRIGEASRLPISAPPAAALRPAVYGPVRLRLRLPASWSPGAREPLVVTGVSRAGDMVYVEYLDAGHIRLGLDHWGSAGIQSPPLAASAGSVHTVDVAMGSLFPARSQAAQEEHIHVRFDGADAIDTGQQAYDSSPYDVSIGTNAIGGSTCGYAFTGQVLDAERPGAAR